MRKLFAILYALFACYTVQAQVTVDVRIDSMALMVGEQAAVTLEVSAASNQRIILPELRHGAIITGDVEVVDVSAIDTAKLNDGQRIQLTQSYTITSFCEHDTLYQLPPFVVKVDDEEYQSKMLALKVFTLDVDTLHADCFCPPKPLETVPLKWEDMRSLVYSGIGLALIIVAVIILLYRYLTGKPIINITLRREKKLPPHQVALNEINRIKAERRWADEDSKEYYTLLTDALRRYMSERYGFSAMEMTSEEIIERLLQQDDVMLEELRQLFTTADLVKFAKASTLIGENDLNLVNAITYIQQTKVEEDPNAQPEPEPVTKEQKQHTLQRRIMLVCIIAGTVVAAVIIGWMAYRLWDLFA